MLDLSGSIKLGAVEVGINKSCMFNDKGGGRN